VPSPQHSYFEGKNAGARAARGAIVALLDSDCEPVPEWLSMLTAPFADAGVSAVAGCTRYTGTSLHAWTFDVPDFSIVVGDRFGEASAFHLNNSAFRRETLLIHPLDARIRRDGGCVLLYHELRAAGARIMYAPQARVSHGLDFAQRGVLKKHFNRGFDGVTVYRADEHEVLRGTHLFRRFGALALIAFTGRRILLDWLRLIRNYDQMGISPATIPYFAAVSVATRLIALTGGITAVFRTGHAPLTATKASR
jgi:GT2 family glycosyltransferase